MRDNSRWVQFHDSPLLPERSEPYLIEARNVPALTEYLIASGAIVKQMSFRNVSTRVEVFDRLRDILVIPDWCGSSWDSLFDAFQEILVGNQFPLFLIIDGFADALTHNTHLALETAIRLSETSRAFSAAQAQFEVIYSAQVWR